METALSKALGDVSLHQVEENEEGVLEVLIASIAEMLDKEPNLLLSSMYRMDIDERKILQILNTHSENDIPTEFAKLVLERQRVALQTRTKFPQKKISDPEASF